ncbi:hypothetical protein Tco_1274358, partial [Tanacetum coccineum]
DSLEKELTKTIQIFRNEVITLKNRVKTLEVALKRKSKKVVLSELEGEEAENSSKQGRKSQDDRSEDFITPSNVASRGVSTYKRIRRSVDTGMDYFSATKERTKSEEVNTGSTGVNTDSTPDKAQRKGKAKMSKLEANAELVKNMQGEDLSEENFAKRMVDMVNQRKKYFAEERAKAKRRSVELQEKVTAKDVPITEKKLEKQQFQRKKKLKKTDKEEDMESIGVIPVATKSPSVVNWKIFQQCQRSIHHIIRANGADTIYISFGAMLIDITRDDLTKLYRTMFEPPLSEDAIWSLPLQQKMLNWRYYDSCGVHCLTLEAAVIYMLTERNYPLSSDACQAMLDMKLQGGK